MRKRELTKRDRAAIYVVDHLLAAADLLGGERVDGHIQVHNWQKIVSDAEWSYRAGRLARRI